MPRWQSHYLRGTSMAENELKRNTEEIK
ncbi:hypothetical protein Tco_0723244, partial [Tanacetum coccineum]